MDDAETEWEEEEEEEDEGTIMGNEGDDADGKREWNLDDLELSYSDQQQKQAPSKENVEELLEELYLSWCGDNAAAIASTGLTEWNAIQIGADIRSETFSHEDLDTCIKKKKHQLKMLHQHCKNLQIFEESGLAKEKVNRIMDVLDAARNQMQASALQSHWMDPKRGEMIVPEEAEEIEQNLFYWEYEKLTRFQHLFKYILRQLKIAEYRKLGDKCDPRRNSHVRLGSQRAHTRVHLQ